MATDPERDGRKDSAHPLDVDFTKLHRSLQELVAASVSELQLRQSILVLMLRLTNADSAAWWSLDQDGTPQVVDELRNTLADASGAEEPDKKKALVAAAIREDRVGVLKGRGAARAVVAVPAMAGDESSGAISVDLSVKVDSLDPFVVILQLAAGYTSFWQAGPSKQTELARSLLSDLSEKILESGSMDKAAMITVDEMNQALVCERTAIGLCRRGNGIPRAAAVSGFDRFDKRSQFIKAFEAAMVETARAGEPVHVSKKDAAGIEEYPAHEAVLLSMNAAHVATLPLKRSNGQLVGCLFFAWNHDSDIPEDLLGSIEASAAKMAALLWLVQAAEKLSPGGPLRRLFRRGVLRHPAGRVLLGLLVSVLLFAPIFPMRVKTGCRLRPVRSRTVCAPFDGVLERSTVRVGDVVGAGDQLAQLDGREIELALAGLVAEQYRARKMATQSHVKSMVAARQMAEYEQEKLEQDIQLLKGRIENLDIKTPISGVVLSGELERAEGAPLLKGQRLFEVAPLDKMLVELLVRDSELYLVDEGMPVSIRIDSYPGKSYSGKVLKIRPMSEIIDMQNIFVAEAELVNTDGLLRPGMKGRAVVKARRTPLFWQILHVPIRFISSKLAGY